MLSFIPSDVRQSFRARVHHAYVALSVVRWLIGLIVSLSVYLAENGEYLKGSSVDLMLVVSSL